ncbi:unnamed protein product [Adineta steineri]|uniref:Uncharacterized protein n=1 Tax=Adineta steineri TaxID=433720 RepID=A0A815TAR0_9BILA|nr:unnamed protein product [Adineta steineri]CAF4036497.1 unnamed protein product [Adineta steineri]
MPSSNHRSSSTYTSRRASTHTQTSSRRSSSVPHRQFIIILTNHPDLLRQTVAFQPEARQRMQTTIANQNGSIRHETVNNNDNDIREQILNTLLQLELGEATRDYLSRTRQGNQIHYVFDMSRIDSSNQSDQV